VIVACRHCQQMISILPESQDRDVVCPLCGRTFHPAPIQEEGLPIATPVPKPLGTVSQGNAVPEEVAVSGPSQPSRWWWLLFFSGLLCILLSQCWYGYSADEVADRTAAPFAKAIMYSALFWIIRSCARISRRTRSQPPRHWIWETNAFLGVAVLAYGCFVLFGGMEEGLRHKREVAQVKQQFSSMRDALKEIVSPAERTQAFPSLPH